MDDTAQVEVVQKQIERLHTELLERLKTFSALWRTVLIGVAGVVALGDDRELGLALQLAPQLILITLAYWLHEQGSMIVAARGIAREESKLNGFAGARLLDYEINRHKDRLDARSYRSKFMVLSALAVSAFTVIAVACTYHSETLRSELTGGIDLRWQFTALLIAAYVAVIQSLVRIFRFVHQ